MMRETGNSVIHSHEKKRDPTKIMLMKLKNRMRFLACRFLLFPFFLSLVLQKTLDEGKKKTVGYRNFLRKNNQMVLAQHEKFSLSARREERKKKESQFASHFVSL